MMDRLIELRSKWLNENVILASVANREDMLLFQERNGVIIPDDMARYFQTVNGTGGEYTDDLYEFNSLNKLQNIIHAFKGWKGIPDYRGILSLLPDEERIFVFGNYQCNLFAYAIKLHRDPSSSNEVFIICGAKYKVIAHSFSEFV